MTVTGPDGRQQQARVPRRRAIAPCSPPKSGFERNPKRSLDNLAPGWLSIAASDGPAGLPPQGMLPASLGAV